MRRWIIIFSIGCLYIATSKSQDCHESPSDEWIESRLQEYGNQIIFDSLLILPSLFALEHYPELKQVPIEFRRKHLTTLMAARPELNFLFRKKEQRTYVVFVNSNPKNYGRKMISNMSQCAQTGIIGHEFAHLLSYTTKSNTQLICFGFKYIFFKKKVERETDMTAIERGLGYQLLDFNHHVRKSELASKKYLKRKDRNYLSVVEIEEVIGNGF